MYIFFLLLRSRCDGTLFLHVVSLTITRSAALLRVVAVMVVVGDVHG